MDGFTTPRRDLLRAAGIGILGLTGITTMETTAGHETYTANAPDLFEPTLIPPDRDAGFNYPYFLYAPEPRTDQSRPILVEPNNTGRVTDDFSLHRERAADLIEGSNGFSRAMSEGLRVPFLVPIFPRPMSDPVSGRHYVHALDTETMDIESGDLERVDLQLLNMVDHARAILSGLSYPVGENIILNGFSASGNFVNRFPVLHPDVVQSVSAGAVNGTAILPIEEDNGHTLNYQIGVANIEDITGEPFDLDAWRDVQQLIYMGGDDENDTIPYSDAWSDEQREKALAVYGRHMQNDRMPYCESVYDEVGAAAEFRIYDGVGHKTTADMQEDVVHFHKRHLGISHVTFSAPPTADSTTVSVSASIHSGDGGDSFDVRVFSESDGDVTASPVTITGDEEVDVDVDLTTGLTVEDTVTAAVFEPGTSDRDNAVVAAEATVFERVHLALASPVNAGEESVEIEYALTDDLTADTPPHLYITTAAGERTLLTTIQPGERGVETVEPEDAIDGIPFEAGAEIQLTLSDMDGGDDLATADTTVEAPGGQQGSDATVAFAEQPLHEETAVTVEYSVSRDYEPTEFVRLLLQREEASPLLLGILEPGESTTETFTFDNLPLHAADTLNLTLRDAGVLARDEALVLVRDPNDDSDSDSETEIVKESDIESEQAPGPIDAVFTSDPDTAVVREPVVFDASGSESPNGDILSYSWEFSDGETGAGQRVTHSFESPGDRSVRLRVVDEVGQTAELTQALSVQAPDRDLPIGGITAGIASIGGIGYFVKRRLVDSTGE